MRELAPPKKGARRRLRWTAWFRAGPVARGRLPNYVGPPKDPAYLDRMKDFWRIGTSQEHLRERGGYRETAGL